GAQPALFGFAGEQWDADTGLVYLRARWYDPASGTFLDRDPFEGYPTIPYSQHPYQYGYSNPARYTDPSGMCVPEYKRVVNYGGRTYLVFGGDPGCNPFWEIGQGPNWQDGREYSWDAFEGMAQLVPGLPTCFAVQTSLSVFERSTLVVTLWVPGLA
ncbi:MAG: RHS repeat-associated core domain-containing protein, partial [Chloroflexaceae bacterium]|nr:RHS repeat-associated core domain-containing protein [Chloroflexaceae bacterium]